MKPNLLQAFLLVLLFSFSPNVFAKSSVWKIAKGDDYFYLGGTIHLLNAADHPLPDEYAKAYSDSDKVILETDMAAVKSIEVQQKLLAAMLSKSGGSLVDELDPKVYAKLDSFFEARQMPIQGFANFQPWAVALTISVLEYQRIGMVAEYGVDEFYNSRALEDKKQLAFLETIEEQVSFLESMATIDPNLMIESTLRDLDALAEFSEFMKTSWRQGDIEAFSTHSSLVQMRAEFPEFYDTIITSRNNNWMTKLDAIVKDELVEFVLVGTLHLNGEVGLLSQLKKRGFSVEQID